MSVDDRKLAEAEGDVLGILCLHDISVGKFHETSKNAGKTESMSIIGGLVKMMAQKHMFDKCNMT